MKYGFKTKNTAQRVINAARAVETGEFRVQNDGGVPQTIPYVALAPDGGVGLPGRRQFWNPATRAFENLDDQEIRIVTQPLCMFVGVDEATGDTIWATPVEEDYPYPYGSYDDGDGGASIQHDAILNLGCDAATTGNILYDSVRYTTVGLVRRGRLTLSISMEILEEDAVAVATECVEVVIKGDETGDTDVECVDGDIVFTKKTRKIRAVVCKACP